MSAEYEAVNKTVGHRAQDAVKFIMLSFREVKPKRKYLWILSRKKAIENEPYEEIRRRLLEIHHYDTSKLIKTLRR